MLQHGFRKIRMKRIEMQGDPAKRGHHVADPRHGARPDGGGKRLERPVEFQIQRIAELCVHRRVAERREAQGLEEFFQ